MDTEQLAGMIFSIILLVLFGGFILLFPISRRLGKVLETRLLQDDRAGADPHAVAQLHEAVRSLEGAVRRLNERQEFVETLIGADDRTALPPNEQRHVPSGDEVS